MYVMTRERRLHWDGCPYLVNAKPTVLRELGEMSVSDFDKWPNLPRRFKQICKYCIPRREGALRTKQPVH